MDLNKILAILNVGQYVSIATQTNEVFALIQLGLSILCTLVLISFRLWKWWKEANADGEITPDEIEKGIKIIEDAKDKVGDKDE